MFSYKELKTYINLSLTHIFSSHFKSILFGDKDKTQWLKCLWLLNHSKMQTNFFLSFLFQTQWSAGKPHVWNQERKTNRWERDRQRKKNSSRVSVSQISFSLHYHWFYHLNPYCHHCRHHNHNCHRRISLQVQRQSILMLRQILYECIWLHHLHC